MQEPSLRQQLIDLNEMHQRREQLTRQEKLDLVYKRIHLRAVIERHGGVLVFRQDEQRYTVGLKA